MTKSERAILNVAIKMAVNIIFRLEEEYGLTDREAIKFLEDKGTIRLLDDEALLFCSIEDEDDETYKIFKGEIPYYG